MISTHETNGHPKSIETDPWEGLVEINSTPETAVAAINSLLSALQSERVANQAFKVDLDNATTAISELKNSQAEIIANQKSDAEFQARAEAAEAAKLDLQVRNEQLARNLNRAKKALGNFVNNTGSVNTTNTDSSEKPSQTEVSFLAEERDIMTYIEKTYRGDEQMAAKSFVIADRATQGTVPLTPVRLELLIKGGAKPDTSQVEQQPIKRRSSGGDANYKPHDIDYGSANYLTPSNEPKLSMVGRVKNLFNLINNLADVKLVECTDKVSLYMKSIIGTSHGYRIASDILNACGNNISLEDLRYLVNARNTELEKILSNSDGKISYKKLNKLYSKLNTSFSRSALVKMASLAKIEKQTQKDEKEKIRIDAEKNKQTANKVTKQIITIAERLNVGDLESLSQLSLYIENTESKNLAYINKILFDFLQSFKVLEKDDEPEQKKLIEGLIVTLRDHFKPAKSQELGDIIIINEAQTSTPNQDQELKSRAEIAKKIETRAEIDRISNQFMSILRVNSQNNPMYMPHPGFGLLEEYVRNSRSLNDLQLILTRLERTKTTYNGIVSQLEQSSNKNDQKILVAKLTNFIEKIDADLVFHLGRIKS
jgi:hypothetical protein